MMLGLPTLVRVALGLFAVAVAAAEKEGEVKEAFSTWAELTLLGRRPGAATELLVQNRAASPIRLANCKASREVPAGGNATMTLAELDAFWVVPEGLAWDCSAGPFDLFYADANLTGAELVASVGYGLFDEKPVSPSASEEIGSTEGGGREAVSYGILGVTLVAGDADTDSDATAVGCGVGSCGENRQATAASEGLTLLVVGPQATLLSNHYGYRGRRWGHHGRWGHGHRGHGHWGHGHRGWRRGGWHR